MARVKRGVTKRHRRHKVLSMTKGHRAARHTRYKVARESLIKALSHAYRHRRQRKGDFRRLWIMRINAAARLNGLNYSQLIDGLNKSGVGLDRKVLADIAVRDPDGFAAIASSAREAREPVAA
jgi:large subunit ribosomal protein L20